MLIDKVLYKGSNTLRTLWCFHTQQKILILAHNDNSVYKQYIYIHILTLHETTKNSPQHLLQIDNPYHCTAPTQHCKVHVHKQEKPLSFTLEGHIFERQAYISVYSNLRCGGDLYMTAWSVEWGIRMLLTLTVFLTVVTATSGEDTHTTMMGRGTYWGEGVALLSSGLADSGIEEEGASLTWTGGHTAGKGERGRKNITTKAPYPYHK